MKTRRILAGLLATAAFALPAATAHASVADSGNVQMATPNRSSWGGFRGWAADILVGTSMFMVIGRRSRRRLLVERQM
jgi:hypothetical protein